MEGIMIFASGMLIAIMLGVNGSLANLVGNNMSVFLIHFTGLIVICLGILLKGGKIKYSKELPFYFYLTGFLGVTIVACNVATFKNIGISNTIALGLTGQVFFSALIDHFGLFNREKNKISLHKVIGFVFIFGGICLVV
jgi:bacterial/archaeal transporter family-2 protein